MNVRLIAEIIGGVAATGTATWTVWHWRKRIHERIARIWKRVQDSWNGISFFKALETFLNEAAVLWFVFPLLNKVFPEMGGGQPTHASDWSWSGIGLVLLSWLAAGMLFIGATVIGKVAENLEDEKERLERESERR